ncbi:MAG: aryl-sulfate sulfotransferase [Myxococcales bacterium]|nr:aryl-sulfate sulfotransferase [Myxococcales bacterium]
MHVHDTPTLALTLLLLAGCGDAGGETSDSDGATPGARLLGEPAFTRYPEQPMVVDLELEFERPTRVELVHDSDPGVRVAANPDVQSEVHGETDTDEPATRHLLRLRGLRPDVEHALTLTATLADGSPDADQAAPLVMPLSLKTLPALPGFSPAYAITRDEARDPDPAYRAFTMVGVYPVGFHAATVMDAEGVTRWHSSIPNDATTTTTLYAGLALRDDGSLLFTEQSRVVILDELGRERVSVDAAQLGAAILHHDVIELPGGSLLVIGTSFREITYPDLGPRLVAGDLLIEFRMPEAQGGAPELLWTWDAFEHLDPQRVRDGFNEPIAEPGTGALAHDWTHVNAVVHDPRDDSLLVSVRHQDWILKLDRETGDIAWRLGIEGDFTLEEGAWFFHQHSPQWQPDGALLVYDNGFANPFLDDALERSRAVRYELDPELATARVVWRDELPPRMSVIAGDVDRLPGGDLLLLDSFIVEDVIDDIPQVRSWLRELDPARPDAAPWSAQLPLNMFVYRAAPWDRLPGETAP